MVQAVIQIFVTVMFPKGPNVHSNIYVLHHLEKLKHYFENDAFFVGWKPLQGFDHWCDVFIHSFVCCDTSEICFKL